MAHDRGVGLDQGRGPLAPAVEPEGHLLSRAAALDIAGKNIDDFSSAFRAEVLQQHPRLGLADEFPRLLPDAGDRKTDSSAARAIQSGLTTRMDANTLDAASM